MVGEGGCTFFSSLLPRLYRFFRLRRAASMLHTVLSSVRAKFCHILLRKKLTETIMEIING